MVALDRDMNEVEVSPDEAKKLKQQHGDKVQRNICARERYYEKSICKVYRQRRDRLRERQSCYLLFLFSQVDIIHRGGVTFFKLKKGAVMYIPKALKFDRFVAGQVKLTRHYDVIVRHMHELIRR